MKKNYIIPESELTQYNLSSLLLEDSLVDYYGGEDGNPEDGTW